MIQTSKYHKDNLFLIDYKSGAEKEEDKKKCSRYKIKIYILNA